MILLALLVLEALDRGASESPVSEALSETGGPWGPGAFRMFASHFGNPEAVSRALDKADDIRSAKPAAPTSSSVFTQAAVHKMIKLQRIF